MTNNAVISTEGRNLLRQESLSYPELLSRHKKHAEFPLRIALPNLHIPELALRSGGSGAKFSWLCWESVLVLIGGILCFVHVKSILRNAGAVFCHTKCENTFQTSIPPEFGLGIEFQYMFPT